MKTARVRLVLGGLVVSLVLAMAPSSAAPQPKIYCDQGDPVCLVLAVACKAMNTAYDKYGTPTRCELASRI
jgi:hypothetical protein